MRRRAARGRAEARRGAAAAALALFCAAARASAGEPWALPELVRRALEENPRAALAEHRMAAARAALDRAAAEFLPVVQVGTGYVRTDNPMRAFGAILNQRAFRPTLDFNDVPTTDDWNASARLAVTLFAGGGRLAALRGAEAASRAREEEREAVRHALALEVARAFYAILKGRALVQAAEAGVRAFEANLDVARRRLEEGTALKTDVLDLEVRLARAREDLVRARNGTALAERALRNLLGGTGGEVTAGEPAPAIPVPERFDPADRPEVRAAAEGVRAAEAAVRRARASWLPRVEAFAESGVDYGWETGRGAGHSTAGIALEWNAWDGWRTSAEMARARAELAAAKERARQIRLAVDLEIERARLGLEEAEQRLEVAGRAVQLAEQSAALARERFRQGLALSAQLLDAETELVAARVRRIEAESDRRVAVVALRKAAGLPPVPLGGEREGGGS